MLDDTWCSIQQVLTTQAQLSADSQGTRECPMLFKVTQLLHACPASFPLETLFTPQTQVLRAQNVQDGTECHGGYQNEGNPQRIYNLTEEISLNVCCRMSTVERSGPV